MRNTSALSSGWRKNNRHVSMDCLRQSRTFGLFKSSCSQVWLSLRSYSEEFLHTAIFYWQLHIQYTLISPPLPSPFLLSTLVPKPNAWMLGNRKNTHTCTQLHIRAHTHTQSFTSIVRALEIFLKETASPRLCWHQPASGGKLCTAIASRSFSAGFQNTLMKRDPAATCWEFWLRPRSLICLDNLA